MSCTFNCVTGIASGLPLFAHVVNPHCFYVLSFVTVSRFVILLCSLCYYYVDARSALSSAERKCEVNAQCPVDYAYYRRHDGPYVPMYVCMYIEHSVSAALCQRLNSVFNNNYTSMYIHMSSTVNAETIPTSQITCHSCIRSQFRAFAISRSARKTCERGRMLDYPR
jgi:hypothetical protein